jgi:transcriptional regulator with XRE-family HTH domain
MARGAGPNDPGAMARAIAGNLRRHRSDRGWTLDQLAARAGLSKGMIVEMERAATNPSLGTLCRVANALGVSVPALVETGDLPVARLVGADEGRVLWRGRRGGTARLLAGLDEPELVELWDWRLSRGDAYRGGPHPARSHEIVHVLEGRLSLRLDRSQFVAGPGETIVFRADRPHTYANQGRSIVRFVMAVVEPKSASG